ncbi:MAG TPA: arylsulfatase [Opitutaceae bacterium]|nr:arylsulfatase [Opitutaceae bacterium]
MRYSPRLFVPLFFFVLCGVVTWPSPAAHATTPPNIIVILADDMGRGDLSCYNPKSAWKTPHLDRLAREGMRFTDAHSGSSVCTPTRYGLLTGRYAWRSRLKNGVLHGFDPSLIEAGRMTVPSLLRAQGYRTAMVGKWHLGLDWEKRGTTKEDVDYRQPFKGGPLAHGFDQFFGISASLDMPPYVYLRNDRAVSVPTRQIEAAQGTGMWRAGPIGDDFAHAEVQTQFIEETERLIGDWGKETTAAPFFLFLSLASPHTPILPTAAFNGSTKTTVYGDFCAEVDAVVGRVLVALEKSGRSRDTCVIFTADNGCSPAANLADLKAVGHDPQMGLRGAKADLFEGGHRVPFIAWWPGTVPEKTLNEDVICLTDLLATCAELTMPSLPADAGEDSVSLVPALLQQPQTRPLRGATVHHSINGSFALRMSTWKLLLSPDSGGWSDPRPPKEGDPPSALPPFQLYDLAIDPKEQTNVADKYPAVVSRLGYELKRIISSGRSTPGLPQPVSWENWPQLSSLRQFSPVKP